MAIHEAIARHDRIALQFSGGKDSLACLYLLRAYWDKLDVCWLDTGDSPDEVRALMASVAERVPRFRRIKSDVAAQQLEFGYPCDVVPIWTTPFGRLCSDSETRIQPSFGCCSANIWEPLTQAMREGGYTLIIRGQRNDEALKSPVRSGEMQDGVEYLFPIEEWARDQVVQYLIKEGVSLPRHYGSFDSSIDCLHCTGYLGENRGKMGYLMEHHPTAAREVAKRLRYIRSAVAVETTHINKALEEYA